MIVADTNLLVAYWAGGNGAALAERIRREEQAWEVPRLWRSEFRNALVGMVRAGTLTPDHALACASDVERALANHEHNVVTHDVIALALRSGCTAYDCEYVALAEGLGVQLVTLDREVLRAFPQRAVAPAAFLRD
jgi:predicted nucleic acid-binding protein